MINNYLDWVKNARKSALHFAYHYREMSRKDRTDWGTGFYAGHAQARMFEARHLRRLQKDMEAWLRNKDNAILPLSNIILSQKFDRYRGGKNERSKTA